MILEIDVTDWEKEASVSPIQLKTKDDLISVMSETNMKPLQLARMGIVLRAQGKADKDILPCNKISLQLGAAQAIARQVTSTKVKVTINGKEHEIPRWTATVTRDENGDESDGFNSGITSIDSPVTLVEYTDVAATDRAIQYLMTNITGHIRSRLSIIAAGKGDVEAVAEGLKAAIDRIASEFV